MQMNQQLDVDVVPPACKFIENETLAQVFLKNFVKFLSL